VPDTFTFADGATLERVHPPSACAGRGCPLHHPSRHHMRLWPMRWNTNARTVERQCGHGRWHPDPDDLAYKRSIDNPMATLMRTMLLREAIASVSLSHPESCECDLDVAGLVDHRHRPAFTWRRGCGTALGFLR
jgi:hypothetical protein